MTTNIRRKTVEAMLRYHAGQKPPSGVPQPVQTALTAAELRAIGAQEFRGKWSYTIEHFGQPRVFQLVPRE